MRKTLVLTAAVVIACSSAFSQSRKYFQVHPPMTENALACDTSLVGARNILRVTAGDTSAAIRYGVFIEGALKFFKGLTTGKEICQKAMMGTVIADSVGGVDLTLVRAIDEKVFDCENFVISMFDIARKMGKIPYVNFVDGHVVVEIDGWCAEMNAATGKRKSYPASSMADRYDTVYLRTCDPEDLRVFECMHLADRSRSGGDLRSALVYCEDAIKVSGGSLPEPYKAAWEIARMLHMTGRASELAGKYRSITGIYPWEMKVSNLLF